MSDTSPLPDLGIELREGSADVGDVSLHYVEAGEGPLVVLLHGFPEFWYGWRLQIAPLAAAGFRVVAPDMRGYNLSTRPDGVHAYDIDKLTTDIRDLVHERGAQSALLAGHDWGGSVAWATAMNHPEVVERLAILNAAHPRKLSQGLHQPGLHPAGDGSLHRGVVAAGRGHRDDQLLPVLGADPAQAGRGGASPDHGADPGHLGGSRPVPRPRTSRARARRRAQSRPCRAPDRRVALGPSRRGRARQPAAHRLFRPRPVSQELTRDSDGRRAGDGAHRPVPDRSGTLAIEALSGRYRLAQGQGEEERR